MELRQLEHFVAVAEEGSFTRAARRLGYVQSALSVSVQAIERELDVRLLDRTTHSVQLTDAGRQLLPAVRATLAAAADVRASAAAVKGVLAGRLAVGIMQSLTVMDMPALLGRFHREHPGVEIMMRPASGGSAELLRWVADGTLDVAFVAASGVPAGVAVEPLAEEELLLTYADDSSPSPGGGAAAGPLALEAITDASFVDFPSGWGVRSAADRAFGERGLERHVAIEVADVQTLVALVEHGLGIALLPASLAPPGRGGLRHRPLAPPVHWQIVLATPSNRQPSAAAATFVELAREFLTVPAPHPASGDAPAPADSP